jgi:hypothetical protein
MLKRWSRMLVLTLAAMLPLAALAAPVKVTTYTSGTLQFADDPVLSTLGLGDTALPAPYEVTLQSAFDPDIDTNFMNGRQLWIFGVDITVTVKIGTSVFEHSGEGLTILDPYNDRSYEQDVTFYAPIAGMELTFKNRFVGPPGSITGDVLLPRRLTSSGENAGSMDIDMRPANPDAEGFWNLGARADHAMLSVLNPVPEPAEWAMMAAGLLAVTVAARRRKQA